MDYGRSLVRQCLMHATAIDYGDCAELQIVCPACAGPLHKRGSAITRMQYLAHYANPLADCELRVRHIVRTELARALVITVPTGENLAAFLLKFEAIVIDHYHTNPSAIAIVLQRMKSRSVYRKILNEIYITTQRRMNEVMAMVDYTFFDVSPHELECIKTTMRFLFAGNTFTVMMFAVSFDLLMRDNVEGAWVAEPWAEALIGANNRQIARWWSQLNQRQTDVAVSGILKMCGITAFHFVLAVSTTHT